MEADVKHIISRYPYSKFKILEAAFLSTAPPGVVPAGICVKPIRNSPGVDSGLFTNGFEMVMVGWTPPGSTPNGGSTPSALHVFDVTQYVPPPPPPAPPDGPPLPLPPSAAAAQQSVLAEYVELDPLSTWIQFRYYDDTTEFEYAFIDIQTFKYLAGEDSNVFYEKNALNQPLHPVTNAAFVPETERGILLSRAFITLHDGAEYKRFRSLRVYPFPEPRLPLNAAGRNSLAFYISPPCPPYWWDQGVAGSATSTGGGSGDSGTSNMMMVSAKQTTNPPQTIDDCNCVINHIDKIALHTQLIDSGFISKEPPPVYKVRIWPWIVLAILLVLLAIIGIVEIARGDVFWNAKSD